MKRRETAIRPFAAGGRRSIAGLMLLFTVFSAVSLVVSTTSTQRSRHRAEVLQVAARQRTLAERYVQAVTFAQQGLDADPAGIATLLRNSATALLDGGMAPAADGDDDETELPPAGDPLVRAELRQEQRLVHDLTATGAAILAGRPVGQIPSTAREHVTLTSPILRLRELAALTSNVSLNTGRTIATITDDDISSLIRLQIALGAVTLLVALALGRALIKAARRQTAHFRSLVTASTDLVIVMNEAGCRYASGSVASMVGEPDERLLGTGFLDFVHPDDRAVVVAAGATGEPHRIEFLLSSEQGGWRRLEAFVTDLRSDRNVQSVVFNARDITERVRLEKELMHQAFHDGLTGLPNRALFHDRLGQAIARSERSGEPVAVAIIDLDRFKQVNDSLGHGSGDTLLQQISRRFAEATRPSDTLARLGGDEFAMVLDGAGEIDALAVAHRLLASLADPVTIDGRELILNASIGVALHVAGATTPGDLVRHADVAMYEAKRAGGGDVELFRSDMAYEVGELLALENDLRHAIQRDELVVYFQPEYELASGQLVGVEALVRWSSPTRGLVMPDTFIPIAETTGLIIPLDQAVLDIACEQTAAWQRDGLVSAPFTTWVNVSGKHISKGGVADMVRDALDRSGLAPEHLGLEITETAIVADGPAGDHALGELTEVRALGVRIAIDDFGTGFSSLAQLRKYPIDVLKVDRSFIKGVEHDPKSAVITANLASLAHALDMLAIAEGIETPAQQATALNLGCDLAQGYLFARPAPADDVTRMLADRRSVPHQHAASIAGSVGAARGEIA